MKTLPILRCVHRKTIEEHPSCFRKGRIKYNFKDDREFEKLTGLPWYNYPEYKIGYLDIESDGLKVDFSTMLTWCIKDKDGDIHHSEITKQELFSGDSDKRLVKDLVDKLWEYRIIIGYFSSGFDIPFVFAKALHYGYEFPGQGDIFHWDLYFTVRNKLHLSRNSLDNACDYLGIKGKTPIDKDVWRAAKYGDPKALREVLEHNKGDVVILEKLHNKLEFSRKWIRKSI
jgi:uncharacterized protein YprB with RNaseH-like and TPR domain